MADAERRARRAAYSRAYRQRYPERVKATRDKWRAANPDKVRANWQAYDAAHPDHGSRYYRANPEAYRSKWLQRNYGIDLDAYFEILASQAGVCAICQRPEAQRLPNGRTRPLSVDHDHETNEVRGLLCHACNVGIGHLNDDPELLEAAAGYLRAASRRRLQLVKDGD